MVSSEEIRQYLLSIGPQELGLDSVDDLTITDLPKGLWNFNYLVKAGRKKLVCKIYSDNIPGLLFPNKGKDEYIGLRILQEKDISPKPILFKEKAIDSRDILIYQYVEGSQLTVFSDTIIRNIAKNLSKFHSIRKAEGIPTKKETLGSLMKDIRDTYKKCKKKQVKGLWAFDPAMRKAEEYCSQDIGHPPAMIHGDLSPCNIIVNHDKVTFIDWQRPTIADAAFDIWAFLEDAFIRWDKKQFLTDKQKELFCSSYITKDNDIYERMKIKSPIYYLNIGLYCLMRYHDFKTGIVDREQARGREHNWDRYRVVADFCKKKLEQDFL